MWWSRRQKKEKVREKYNRRKKIREYETSGAIWVQPCWGEHVEAKPKQLC